MMLSFDTNKMLFTMTPDTHEPDQIERILKLHPEVQYVSFVGVDMGGHDTDEKIPTSYFLKNIENFMKRGVQTDGSSVALPKIADLCDAKVDMIPDKNVNWYVDYNMRNIDNRFDLPVGTLRIPSFLVHNENFECCSRSVLKKSLERLKNCLLDELRAHPEAAEFVRGLVSVDEVDDIQMTSATELEFWVKTPDDKGDREQLFTSQVLKEQYWKRTYGDVRTALEDTLFMLDRYGFEIEMGHKELGGVKAKMGAGGHYDHVMEQLEIDWKYAGAMQAADNENQVKYVVRDIFTMHGLDVTFMAKPFQGVTGSGEHTHMGIVARTKDGRIVNLFSAAEPKHDFLSSIGFGALLGILRNYEVIEPFISATNDALNRLKPGFEAPVSIVTSLGRDVAVPSRNRTVLIGLIRDADNPAATRFELRSPNPKSNTYLVLAASYMAMLDGLLCVLRSSKTPKELEISISKKKGCEDFYLEKDREYRSEEDIFVYYTEKERRERFGRPPATVWECLNALDEFPEKLQVITNGGVMESVQVESFREQALYQWVTELHDRILPQSMNTIRDCRKHRGEQEYTDKDEDAWRLINKVRHRLAVDSSDEKCLITEAKEALDDGDYDKASELQLEIKEKMEELIRLYAEYRKNLL